MVTLLGQNIKRIRSEKGFTQKELSNLSKVSQSTITEIEKGTRKSLRADNLSKIAIALEVSTNELLGIEENIEYELTDLESTINIVFAEDSNLELENIKLSSTELSIIKTQLKAAIDIIKAQRSNN